MHRVPRGALIVVGAVMVFRLIVAARIPLTEDESYYWSWSRHLAFGYLDHPPMVAWLIALTSPLGRSPLLVRLPFILCEAVAALALGRTAAAISGNARAETATVVLFSFIAQPRFAIGEALPDGPYLAGWALSLFFMVRAANQPSFARMVPLGIALGATLLSRFFGWALVGGITMWALFPVRTLLWRRGLWIALGIAVALVAPLFWWNATHAWMNVIFTFQGRHDMRVFSIDRFTSASTIRAVVFGLLVWIVAYVTAIRPRYPLLAWTALPLATLLMLLSFFETTESYWLLGPVASLCVGIGIAYAGASIAWQRLIAATWLTAGAYTMVAVAFIALPEGAQTALLRASDGRLKAPFYSGTFTYASLAEDLGSTSRHDRVEILTDQFEIASELLYHGVQARIVEPAPQVPQWESWYLDGAPAGSAVFVGFVPIAQDPQLLLRAHEACNSLAKGPTLSYRFAQTQAETFYTQRCSLRADAAYALFREDAPAR